MLQATDWQRESTRQKHSNPRFPGRNNFLGQGLNSQRIDLTLTNDGPAVAGRLSPGQASPGQLIFVPL